MRTRVRARGESIRISSYSLQRRSEILSGIYELEKGSGRLTLLMCVGRLKDIRSRMRSRRVRLIDCKVCF